MKIVIAVCLFALLYVHGNVYADYVDMMNGANPCADGQNRPEFCDDLAGVLSIMQSQLIHMAKSSPEMVETPDREELEKQFFELPLKYCRRSWYQIHLDHLHMKAYWQVICLKKRVPDFFGIKPVPVPVSGRSSPSI